MTADGHQPEERTHPTDEEVGYGVREVAGLFALAEHRLRYWSQTGFIVPSLRREGRPFYSFRDLVAIKVAKALVDDGVSLRRIRRSLALLRAHLPGVDTSLAQLRVRCDDDRVIVDEGERSYEAESGQLVLDFSLASLREQVASVIALPRREPDDGPRTAHDWFRRGCELEQERAGAPCDLAGLSAARQAYETALGLDATLAAAWTNLGGLLAEIGDLEGAREHFTEALRCDPDQVEALCNLAELAMREGDHESAISTYRHVLRTTPDWLEAHYGLARALLAVGGKLQALAHLERFCTAVGAIAPELREPEIDERRSHALLFVEELRSQLGQSRR